MEKKYFHVNWDTSAGILYHFFNLIYSICGTLHSVDQFLNIKLTDITVTDPDKYPHMVSQFVCINNSENHGYYKSAFFLPHI